MCNKRGLPLQSLSQAPLLPNNSTEKQKLMLRRISGVQESLEAEDGFNPFRPEFTIVIFIHYKPRIAVAILDL